MMAEFLRDAFAQVFAVLTFCVVFFAVHRLVYRKGVGVGFSRFMGLQVRGLYFDRSFVLYALAFALLGALQLLLSWYLDPDYSRLVQSEFSPLGRILRTESSVKWAYALVYCFITAGLSEELLFRGLIAKRMIAWLGFQRGNIGQALIFWMLHVLILKLVVGQWFSISQGLALLVILPMGWVLGYFNEKKAGGSIIPSCLFHSITNFTSFLVLWLYLSS